MKLPEFFANIFENKEAAVVLTEPSFDRGGPRILFANEAFEKMTGYKACEVVGKTPKMLQGKKTRQLPLKRMLIDLKRGDFGTANVVNYRKNGEEYNCDITVLPIHDEQENLIYFAAIERETYRKPGRPKHSDVVDQWWNN